MGASPRLGPPAPHGRFPWGLIPGPPPPVRSVAAGLPRHVTRQPTGPGKLPANPPALIPCLSNSGRVAAFLCAFGDLSATGRAGVVDSVATGPDLSERASVAGFPTTTRPPPTRHARSGPAVAVWARADTHPDAPRHDQFATGLPGPLGRVPVEGRQRPRVVQLRARSPPPPV